ncbi:MAG: hypothetical protein WCO25_00180 [Candidatus Uhrbacteria bacterium]
MQNLTPWQKRIVAVGAIISVVLIAAFAWVNTSKKHEGFGSLFSIRSEVLSPEDRAKAAAPVPTEAASTPKPKTLAVDVPLNYGDAVNEYGDVRFQFVACHGTPGSMVAKKGSVMMLDNRDDKAHVIAMGAATYKLKALDYALAIASETGDLQVTCDGGGAANISVQP